MKKRDDKKTIKSYQFKKLISGLTSTILFLLFSLWFLLSGSSIRLRNYVSSLSDSQTIIIALFTVIFFAVVDIITLPVDFYKGYILEEKYGLSNEKVTHWLKDEIKAVFLTLILGVAVIETIYAFIGYESQSWWIMAGAVLVLFMVILSNLAPLIIFPLFFRFVPLKDEELRNRLADMAEGEGVRIKDVYEMDLSRKTRAANAALAGLGNTRRVILSDTLIENFTNEEIESVVAHELGHHRYNHLWKGMALQSLLIFTGFYLADKVVSALIEPLNLDGINDIAALPLLILIMSCAGFIFLPLSNIFSRKMESEADIYALEKTKNIESFISCMERLALMNLADTNPNKFVKFLFYSHPTVEERINMAEDFNKRRSQANARIHKLD